MSGIESRALPSLQDAPQRVRYPGLKPWAKSCSPFRAKNSQATQAQHNSTIKIRSRLFRAMNSQATQAQHNSTIKIRSHPFRAMNSQATQAQHNSTIKI